MGFYIVKRLTLILPTVVAVTLVIFLISHVIPADPVQLAAGLRAGPEQVAQLRHEMGLDKPVYVQYFVYLGRLVRGDLGRSMRTTEPVSREVLRYLPATAELAIATMVVLVLVGVPLGILSSKWRRKTGDMLVRGITVAVTSMPVFWVALLLQLLFYRQLGVLPAVGRAARGLAPERITGFFLLDSVFTGNGPALASSLTHLLLPAAALVAGRLALVVRMTRACMLEVLEEEYVLTARAKGLRETVVVYKHALKNAAIPIVTELGLQFGWLLGGTVLVEAVFSWPGLGLYAIDSILQLDFMPVMAITLVFTLTFAVVNTLVDLSYAALNPRIRYGKE
jgi:peptide/nickel transport system permease protein